MLTATQIGGFAGAGLAGAAGHRGGTSRPGVQLPAW
jgi:hypothetical protein